jgi:lipopolysaccharide biosynthesis protein
MRSKRLALFAHYDAEDTVKRYVVECLARLRGACDRIVFVSTSHLSESEMAKVRPHCEAVLLKDNTGYDFGMWQHALEHTDLAGVDELVLTNSSVFGPIHPLEPIFRRMAEDPCDFWGMTDNFEYRWHLQSYFLVFKREVLRSEAFRSFFWSVLPYRSKGPVVLGYEVGLTSFLVDSGFRPGAFAPVESWASWVLRRRMDLERRWNPTLFHPLKLLSRGMPFVKVMLLRDNVGMVPLAPVYRAMAAAGYDLDLIELDRAPIRRASGLRARVRRLWSRIAVESEKISPMSAPAAPPHGARSAAAPFPVMNGAHPGPTRGL